jgi:hypothetical protein
MLHTLTFELIDSFTKERTIKDVNGLPTTKKARRYRFAVSGSKEAIAKYREDIENGYIGGEDHNDYGLVWYSWEPKFGDTLLKRARKKDDEDYCRWFQDTSDLDALEETANKYPSLAKLAGAKFLENVFNVNKKVHRELPDNVEQDRNLDD